MLDSCVIAGPLQCQGNARAFKGCLAAGRYSRYARSARGVQAQAPHIDIACRHVQEAVT